LEFIDESLTDYKRRLAFSENLGFFREQFDKTRQRVLSQIEQQNKQKIAKSLRISSSAFRELSVETFESQLISIRSEDPAYHEFIKALHEDTLIEFKKEFKDSETFAKDLQKCTEQVVRLLESGENLNKKLVHVEQNPQIIPNQPPGTLNNNQNEQSFDLPNDFDFNLTEKVKELKAGDKSSILNLQEIFRVGCQMFFIYVLPSAYFLKIDLPERNEVTLKAHIIQKIISRKNFYLRILNKWFPVVKHSHFFEIVFQKLENYCFVKFEQWLQYCTEDQYHQTLQKMPNILCRFRKEKNPL
jgi:hypothetical protein